MLNTLDTRLETVTEQRQNQRYAADEDLYIVLSSDPSQLCKVLDLSEDGLAFNYENKNGGLPRKKLTLNVILPNGGFNINDIRFKSISETVSINSDSVPMTRCGIKCSKMSQNRSYWLDYILQNNTLDK